HNHDSKARITLQVKPFLKDSNKEVIPFLDTNTLLSSPSTLQQFSSQEISKSLVQSQTQQPQVHQNFSPVSNPSPAASGLQSPSCSSSPSPLMGVSEGSRNSVTPSQVTSQTPLPNSRNTHTRLLRATPQLSPTPSSNSSISSCGSSVVNVNTTNVKATAGDAHIGSTQSQMGKGGISEENLSCPYPLSVDKLTREPEINSLNALTSQVANLPNIVQDMQVSQNRGKDNDSQQKGRGGGNDCTNAAKDGRRDSGDTSDSVVVESPIEIKQEGEEQLLAGEGGRTRQISGVNESSNVTSHTSSKNQSSKDVHLMTQQGHKQKTERSAGEPNPLMMRRRVRSFISPIPAKRQHQDLSQQQQQRNTTSRYQSPLQNSAHRHHDTDTSSPEVSYSKLALPETGCPSLTQNLSSAPTSPQGKTKILPARKGRGLKLEAIVQKITPNKENVKEDVARMAKECILISHSWDPYLHHHHYLVQCKDLPLLHPHTYQQLETRRGEDTTANFLRRKLNETGMTLGVDDYVDTDFFGSSSFHHSQNSGLCLLTRPPNSQQLHQQHHFAQTVSSMKSPSQLSEARPLENVVPKGYFPSGKKKGRPVGSVNKQKRSQSQTQNTSISAPPVLSTSVQMTTPTPAHTVSPEVVPVTTTPIPVTHPADSEGPYEVSSTDCQVKIDTEKENATATVELEPTRPIQQNKNDESQGNGIEDKQRKRKRRVAALMGKEVLQSSTGAEFLSVTEIFADHKTFVFAPYIHVERKVKEIGAVCTIVNEELDRIKWESGGEKGKEGGRSDIVLDSTLSSDLTRGKRDTEILNKEPKMEQDPMSLQSCTAGKTIPLSGYVLSGPLMTESSNVGHLLCCLCKKWANYKNLGDLFGPYYSPEYVATLPKNQPQIRHTLGTTKVCNKGVLLETPVLESNKKEIQQTESQTAKSAVDCTEKEVTHLVSHAAATAPVDEWEMPDVLENICNVYTDREVAQKNDLINEPITPLKQHEQMQTEESLQNGPQQTEDIQYRPQHRKLTSHPRFKRRHRSSEDLLKTGPSNFKALLPFQPPPQLPNQDPSEPFVHLSQLPEIPLDPEELWVHEGCIAWASGVFLVNGRLYGLQEALDGARDTSCSYCGLVGSTLGCYSKGCSLRYHYLCAIEADCSLNEDNFSMRCPKHKARVRGGDGRSSNGCRQRRLGSGFCFSGLHFFLVLKLQDESLQGLRNLVQGLVIRSQQSSLHGDHSLQAVQHCWVH
ncbi:transcription factor 20-like, partial [Scleropages formosus]